MIAARRGPRPDADDTPSPAYRARRALGVTLIIIGGLLVVLAAFGHTADRTAAVTLAAAMGLIMGGIAVLVTLAAHRRAL